MWKTMKARYKGWCRRCYKDIAVDEVIEYHTTKKTTRHPDCEKGERFTLTGKVRRVV